MAVNEMTDAQLLMENEGLKRSLETILDFEKNVVRINRRSRNRAAVSVVLGTAIMLGSLLKDTPKAQGIVKEYQDISESEGLIKPYAKYKDIEYVHTTLLDRKQFILAENSGRIKSFEEEREEADKMKLYLVTTGFGVVPVGIFFNAYISRKAFRKLGKEVGIQC